MPTPNSLAFGAEEVGARFTPAPRPLHTPSLHRALSSATAQRLINSHGRSKSKHPPLLFLTRCDDDDSPAGVHAGCDQGPWQRDPISSSHAPRALCYRLSPFYTSSSTLASLLCPLDCLSPCVSAIRPRSLAPARRSPSQRYHPQPHRAPRLRQPSSWPGFPRGAQVALHKGPASLLQLVSRVGAKTWSFNKSWIACNCRATSLFLVPFHSNPPHTLLPRPAHSMLMQSDCCP